jgi:hypothetical protein
MAGNLRTEIMKIMLGTTIAVSRLGIGSSHADDGDGHSATTLFTSFQNERAVATQNGTAQNGGGGSSLRQPLAGPGHMVVPGIFVTLVRRASNNDPERRLEVLVGVAASDESNW